MKEDIFFADFEQKTKKIFNIIAREVKKKTITKVNIFAHTHTHPYFSPNHINRNVRLYLGNHTTSKRNLHIPLHAQISFV